MRRYLCAKSDVELTRDRRYSRFDGFHLHEQSVDPQQVSVSPARSVSHGCSEPSVKKLASEPFPLRQDPSSRAADCSGSHDVAALPRLFPVFATSQRASDAQKPTHGISRFFGERTHNVLDPNAPIRRPEDPGAQKKARPSVSRKKRARDADARDIDISVTDDEVESEEDPEEFDEEFKDFIVHS